MNRIAQESVQAMGLKRQATTCQKLEVCRSSPKLAKKSQSRIPAPQIERIMQRHVAGESIREIAREERRARQTVVRVIRSDEMGAYVRTMRERLYGLGSLAVDAIQHALQQHKDVQLAYRLLIDIGVIPNPDQRHLITTRAAAGMPGGPPEGYSPALMALAKAIYDKTQMFKMPLPAALADSVPQEAKEASGSATSVDHQ